MPGSATEGGALVFAGGAVGAGRRIFLDRACHACCLFWAAFILTRPLGATVGDFLDKPVSDGGLALSRPLATAVIGVFLVFCLLFLPQRAGQHPTEAKPAIRQPVRWRPRAKLGYLARKATSRVGALWRAG